MSLVESASAKQLEKARLYSVFEIMEEEKDI